VIDAEHDPPIAQRSAAVLKAAQGREADSWMGPLLSPNHQG